MSLCCTRRNAMHKSAFVKSSYLRWFLGDLHFNGSLPRPDYVHRLVEHFRVTSSPESMRLVVFSPDEILCEYVSASCHLPGAYVEFFPCPHCTHTEKEDDDYEEHFVEVFHFANVHNPNVCATVTFIMPAVINCLVQPEFTGCRVEVEFTNGCPNAPIAVEHSPRVVLHTDGFIEVLRFLPRSELETAMLVSRRWSNVIGWVEGSLQQRRSFIVLIKFYGESSGMLVVYFLRRELLGQGRILRVLTTRGLSQALYAVRSHFRNASVEGVQPAFYDSIPSPGPPRDVLVDIPLPLCVNWLMSLLHSMPRNSVINCWSVQDTAIGFDNIPSLVRCALKPHMKLGRVQQLELCLSFRNATWARWLSLLNQPSIRRFNEITIWASAAIDTSGLCALLSSRRSPKLHLIALSEIEPQDPLLTQPAQLVRFYGESSGMLSVHFKSRELAGRWPILRVLTTRGLSQALYSVRSHFRNAFVEAVIPYFFTNVPPPGPPREVLVDIPLPRRVDWLMSFLHSMPLNSVINRWSVQDVAIGFNNIPSLVRCALKPHRKLGCVRELELDLSGPDATDITVSTKVTIDSSEVLTILSSRRSPKQHLNALSEIEPQDPLLTLPAHLIREFVALRDVSSFVAEFSLRLEHPANVVFLEMPDVNDATDRQKRFRYHLQGKDTVVRVRVYANRAARECLTVVTFDHFRRTVRFFKGNVSLADLKLTLRRLYDYY